VDDDLAKRTNCVDPEVARQMAVGGTKMFGTRLCIATTGYAEPWPEERVDTPYAYYCVTLNGVVVSQGRVDDETGDRTRWEMKEFVAQKALEALLQALRGLPLPQ